MGRKGRKRGGEREGKSMGEDGRKRYWRKEMKEGKKKKNEGKKEAKGRKKQTREGKLGRRKEGEKNVH